MRNGRLIEDNTKDLNLNLAIEHSLVLLHSQSTDDLTIRIWNNPPSVVLGRGQKFEEEVNTEFCSKNNIKIGRRISGGGAVYHDEGNINVSFFIKRNHLEGISNLNEYKQFFTEILKKSLESIEIDKLTVLENNILLDGKKVSGSAGYLTKSTYLHHATLLVSANLENLEGSLLVKTFTKRNSRSSSYIPTANIANFDLKRWKTALLELIKNQMQFSFKETSLKEEELKLANKLKLELYSNDKWIFEGKRIMIKS